MCYWTQTTFKTVSHVFNMTPRLHHCSMAKSCSFRSWNCSREAAVIEEAEPAMVTCSGAAKSDEEAERVCEALKNAGIVLRVGDMVYLKPEEVVEIILRVSFPSVSQAYRSSD